MITPTARSSKITALIILACLVVLSVFFYNRSSRKETVEGDALTEGQRAFAHGYLLRCREIEKELNSKWGKLHPFPPSKSELTMDSLKYLAKQETDWENGELDKMGCFFSSDELEKECFEDQSGNERCGFPNPMIFSYRIQNLPPILALQCVKVERDLEAKWKALHPLNPTQSEYDLKTLLSEKYINDQNEWLKNELFKAGCHYP